MLEESQLSPWSSILLYQHSLIWSHDSKYPLYILTPKFLYPAHTSFLHFRILHPQWPTPHSHSENQQKQNSASSLKHELLSFPSDVSLLAKRASLWMLKSKTLEAFVTPLFLAQCKSYQSGNSATLTFKICPGSAYFSPAPFLPP